MRTKKETKAHIKNTLSQMDILMEKIQRIEDERVKKDKKDKKVKNKIESLTLEN